MILKNCDMYTLSNETKNREIVCYGIGEEFHSMINNYEEYPWCENIKYLVDGDSKKKGIEKTVKGNKLRIYSLEEFLAVANDNMIIIVTCGAFKEIVTHLNTIPKLDKVVCYIYHFMFGLSEHREIQIAQTKEQLIPPIIHYCWFGGKELPDLYKRCIDSWHTYCPNYEIKRWDESNCDIEENLFAKQAYSVGKFGFVPDYFRLKIIYEHGGIYLDTDVEMLQNFDELRYNQAFCGMETPGRVGLGLGFGAVKGNETIRYMLKRYQKMQFIDSDGKMDETPSNIWQIMDMRELGMSYGNVVHKVNEMTVYPVEVLSPKSNTTGELDITKYSYSIHHFDASWFSGEARERKRQLEMDVATLRALMNKEQ